MRARWIWFASTLGLLSSHALADEPPVPPDVLRAWEALRRDPRASPPRAPRPPLPALTRWALANGLDVVLAPDPRDARVRVSVTWRVGDGDAPPGQRQAAHAAEHLLFRAAPGLTAIGPELAAVSIGRGGGTTYSDRTVYEGESAPEHLDRLLWLEAQRMAHAARYVRADALDAERPVLHHEAELTTGRWHFLRGLSLRAALPPTHRSHTSWDDLRAVDALDVGAVEALVRDRYAPGNARLVVAGHFDPAAARASIERYFAPVPARPIPPRQRDDGPLAFTTSHLRARTVHPAAVVIAWPGPAADDCHDAGLRVLAAVLRRSIAVDPWFGAPDPESPRWSLDVVRQGARTALVFEARLAVGQAHDVALRAMDAALGGATASVDALRPVEPSLRDALLDAAAEAARDLPTRTTRVADVPSADDPGGFRCERATTRDVTPAALRDLARELFAARRLVVDFHHDPAVVGLQLDEAAP
ncbi:MAG: insulinase family protein [Polyangiales bacterium]